MKIQVNHIGKMEGHTDFVAEIIKGDVKSAKIMTTEGARLIEGILVGRHFSEAPIITSRICGICPVIHKVCSVKALEKAMAISPSTQTVKLRKAMLMAQTIHSHALHLFFLSLPDFFDITNDLKFIGKYKKETECAIGVRQWALKAIEVIGGRAVHPIACEVGGFKTLPSRQELKELSQGYESALKDALCLVNMVTKVKLPQSKRKTTFIALKDGKTYPFYGGNIGILYPDGKSREIDEVKFTKHVKEIEEPYRAAKSAELDGEPFMVGALARININHSHLNPLAAGIFKSLKWKMPQYNVFHNITCQAIEVVHCVEELKALLEDLSVNLEDEISKSAKLNLIASANPLGKESWGSDAAEAPRGTLYHHYKISADGYLREAKVITPTVSFLKNLEADIAAYLPDIKNMPEKKRSLKIRALIRAYDPCISCATH
ncbi:MAG: NAD-reducing hydrogenase HoxS subunit beta [Parcubacteria group bacterium ADurb.Bin326]|nr:MAG: NAD-reducing hydrogenase HoxS subunit beta [Parcubacteria group bacterium ADurb.Bin326]